MEFEFDPDKSAINKDKHGIDFVEAQALWDDGNTIEAAAKDHSEPRFMAIGKIGEKHWVAICIIRGEAVRIISVRRARDKEIFLYESKRNR